MAGVIQGLVLNFNLYLLTRFNGHVHQELNSCRLKMS